MPRPPGSPNRSTSSTRPKVPTLTPDRHRAVFGRAESPGLPALTASRRTPEEEIESELASIERQLKILTHCKQQLDAKLLALHSALDAPAPASDCPYSAGR